MLNLLWYLVVCASTHPELGEGDLNTKLLSWVGAKWLLNSHTIHCIHINTIEKCHTKLDKIVQSYNLITPCVKYGNLQVR